MKNTMSNKIFHYRLDGTHDECADQDPWGQCLFSGKNDSSMFKSKPLLAIGGQTVIAQHHATYITGRDTCHAHHFAKMVAGALLSGSYDRAPSLSLPASRDARCTCDRDDNDRNSDRVDCAAAPVAASSCGAPASILWIDTVHSPYECAQLYDEMQDTFHFDESQLRLMCLDMLGVFREDFYSVIGRIESHIREFKPTLVIIDDVDHFLPYCGINIAAHLNNIFRDAQNHTETAFLFIGYNHLGKRASTTGNLGKILFPSASAIFSITTQNGISRMKLVRAFSWRQNVPDAEFIFSLSSDNFPHEMIKAMPSGNVSPTFVEHNTLQDIIGEVIKPDETLTPDELVTRISQRQTQLNRIDRARTLVAQAMLFGFLNKNEEDNRYTLTTSNSPNSINTILTLPPHPSPSTEPSDSSQSIHSINPTESGESSPSTTRAVPAAAPPAA